ncbi:YutD family protein [uncultured Lactobacillus sp.]|uniref:YutD family protein n=1 Tax=uncultured Lactobacillus sp. TaxID=153152 RepID=UPI00261BD305|nr:YutD family protein [uncultured Lactobacillus sp.]
MRDKEHTNNTDKKQRLLRHPLAHVVLGEDVLLIDGRKYEILANVRGGLDVQMLREKYDPFLNQYDYIVGDVSSEHLRLKGFYDENDHVSIDKKATTIVDYLEEYCNPGSAYFVIHLLGDNPVKKVVLGRKNKRQKKHYNKKQNFTERRVRKTKIKSNHSVAIKSRHKGHKNKSFVIKKRKGKM